ncbi:MAG TPA: AarF/ABC1/UbiB kinase family protein [Stellaceae bacterium]|nr:AarF/ABC1/UbiB kinase family protein [Stellaceae bacterium]
MAGDEGTIAGRVKRFAQVGGTVGGLAARLAGQRYLGIGIDAKRHAADLTAALGGIKGPLMKVAQILSTIPGALPKEYSQQLAQLQANAPPMGWPFVKRRMTTELGPAWQSRFESFQHEAAHAASLGQVHWAEGLDGQRLACKLQYPDMASAVDADLGQLRLILGIYERYDRAVSTGDVYQELAARLREELDYTLEAKHMRLYACMLGGEAGVSVPVPIPELSTKRLITMTRLDGRPIARVADEPAEIRHAVAMAMFRIWYRPFYEYGVIHGDPHLGNYTVRADNGINLLDFGCIRVFPPAFVKGVIDLYRALQNDDEALAIQAYESWGFKRLSREMIDVLNMWARFLYAPLLENAKRRIDGGESGQYGRDVAEKVHKELHRLGGVRPPREFVFMDRAAIGLGSLFLRLKAEINWYELFHDLIGGFDADELGRRQARLLDDVGIALPDWAPQPNIRPENDTSL